FFQAEDGIRDRNVTGVQTCALPILIRSQMLYPLSYGRRCWTADHCTRLRATLTNQERRRTASVGRIAPVTTGCTGSRGPPQRTRSASRAPVTGYGARACAPSPLPR